MRIVDAFLFSEPHEKEVLLIKLNLGARHVTEWVLVENEYTHQAEFKGLHAREMIDGDPRFDPFKDRLTIISGTHRFPEVDRARIDEQGLAADRAQRELARDYLLDTYDDDTWVLVSDADEALDVSSDENYDYLCRKVAKLGAPVVPLPRTRYWYDIDNLWLDRRATTLVRLGEIRHHDTEMGQHRQTWTMRPIQWPKSLVYEYSVLLPARGHREEVPVVRTRRVLAGRDRPEHRLQSRTGLGTARAEAGPHVASVVVQEGEAQQEELFGVRAPEPGSPENERRSP